MIEYRKPVFIILAIAALFAIVFSTPFFITPLYKSTAIIYPTSSNSISKVLISTTYQSEKDIMNFGEDEQTEQMLQVLNSNRVRDKVIERFDLMNHYDIKAAMAKMMNTGFLYSINNLHKYLELYELCCCSSILHYVSK